MDENKDQNNPQSKSKMSNTNLTLQTGDTHAPQANEYCSVPILQKVLVPYPGYETRLYSVQMMRSSEAKDYYQNMSVKEEKQCSAQNERERSPMRDSRTTNEYWNSLNIKGFKQYKA